MCREANRDPNGATIMTLDEDNSLAWQTFFRKMHETSKLYARNGLEKRLMSGRTLAKYPFTALSLKKIAYMGFLFRNHGPKT